MALDDKKLVQSFIQGILVGQADVEAGLAILLDTPDWQEERIGWALIHGGIGIMLLMRATYFTHNPALAGSNLSGAQAAQLNAYYNDLVAAQTAADVDGGRISFPTDVNQALTDHTSIITTLKSKDMPSHGIGSLA